MSHLLKLKKLIFSIGAILLLSQPIYSQHVLDGTIARSDSEQINDINKLVSGIKANLTSYTKTSVYNPDSSGYGDTYKKDKELILISLLYHDKMEDKNVTYYFRNNQMFYGQTLWTNRTTGTITKNERYYLNNEYLFAWFRFDKQVDVNSDEFKEAIKPMRNRAEELRADSMK